MTYRIVGYAIISEDGMLADASGAIPPAMIVTADQDFLMRGLDAATAVIHGRNSAEQPAAPSRQRLIATRQVSDIAALPGNPNARLWNPAGAPFADALGELGVTGGDIAIIGGTDIFGLFLREYEVFHLSRVAGLRLPDGIPVFPGVPLKSADAMLTEAGMTPGPERMLDAAARASVVTWTKAA